MTPQKANPYSIPLQSILRISASALTGRERSFRTDALMLTSQLNPPLQVTGLNKISPQQRYLITVNHYTRPGLNAWWIALVISSLLEQDVHWIMTNAWQADEKWVAGIYRSITHWAFSRLAKIYDFSTIPPLPVRKEDAHERSESVRKILSLARNNSLQAIGFVPEGRDFPGNKMGWPPYSTGRFVHYLNRMGYRILPVGLYEDKGALHVNIGEPYDLDDPHSHASGDIDPITFRLVARRQIDMLLTRTVMRRIAVLLPENLQGEFR